MSNKPTEAQASFAAKFWADKLGSVNIDGFRVPSEKVAHFQKEVKRLIYEEIGIRSVSCYYGPFALLNTALKAIDLDDEPPILRDHVDLIFNPDGTIDLRDGENSWENLTP